MALKAFSIHSQFPDSLFDGPATLADRTPAVSSPPGVGRGAKPREIWTITVTADGSGPAATLRIRKYLKLLLRVTHLRCLDLRLVHCPPHYA